MKIGCLFGSFNPVHSGHLHLAEMVIDKTDIDEVWFIISPQNPFKVNKNMVNENQRKYMVDLMIEHNSKLKSCDIEFNLPKPSYTHKTIDKLNNTYKEHTFQLIIGSDALNDIKKWEKFNTVIQIPIIAFIRDDEKLNDNVVKIIKNLKTIHSKSNTSSTFIRNHIVSGEIDELLSLKLLNKKLISYIKDNKLYKICN